MIFFYRFVQQKLGGPSLSEYEKLKLEMTELQVKYNELLAAHQETCRQVSFVLKSNIIISTSSWPMTFCMFEASQHCGLRNLFNYDYLLS